MDNLPSTHGVFMKITAALIAAACSVPLAHAEDIASSMRTCSSFSSAADFVSSTAISKKPHIIDGVSYFKPRANLVYGGSDILAVFAYGRGLKGATDNQSFGYGVVIEGTEGYASMLVNGTPEYVTTSAVSLPDHEFVEIGCNR